MTDDPFKAWMGAWTAAQETLAGANAGAEIAQRLREFGQDYAGFATGFWGQFPGAGQPPAAAPWQGSAALQAALAEHYRGMISPAMPPEVAAAGALPALAAAVARCQRAGQALAAQATAIGADAARRLVAELSRTDAAAAPITTLAALHELWIECGEAAWAAAVHQDGYAAAQSEWLSSLIELQFEQQRLRQSERPPAGSGS